MDLFSNLSIKYKLLLQISIITLTVIILFLFSYDNFTDVKTNQEAIASRYSLARYNLGYLKDRLARFNENMYLHIIKPQSFPLEKLESDFAETSGLMDIYLNELEKYLLGETSYESELMLLRRNIAEFSQVTRGQLTDLRIGNTSNAVNLTTGRQSAILADIFKGTKIIGDQIRSNIDSLLRKSASDIQKGIVTFWVLLAVTIIVSILIFFQSNNMLTKPLADLTEISDKIAGGDLNVSIKETTGKDEIARLSASYGKMISSLHEVADFASKISAGQLTHKLQPRSANDGMINSLNTMIEKLKEIIGSTKDGIGVLSNSTNQILSATAQLASSSTETATAISETSSTIEEVKKTSEISSKKSREVSVVAQQATEISEKGKNATEETIDAIHKIGDQMKTIALSIDRLSEQSRSIGEIISTVNDLAEQSNLLAVNASIEAARAGEQGKIFVVVAQEIKSLAEQSKQATSQVKNVLNDVQSAISLTVSATTEGEKIVGETIHLSEEAQKSIIQLSNTINIFNDAALQTSVSSQEQFIGMDQVAVAMGNIKTASMQNAQTTKALELSSKDLQSLSARLRDITSVFTIG